MSRPRILIVDDDALVADYMRALLGSAGYDVAGLVAFGERAADAVVELRPDLVVMDIGLRGSMSGLDAADHIRAHSAVPILFVTGYSDARYRDRAHANGHDYLVKPVVEEELLRAVSANLSRQTGSAGVIS